MAKKKKPAKKETNFSGIYFSALLVLTLASLLSIFVWSKFKNPEIVTTKEVTGVSTPAPFVQKNLAKAAERPKPSKTPAPIPESYGRSVNVPILYYHYIGTNGNPQDKARDNLSVAPDKFDEQLGYIAGNGYNVITLDTLVAALRGNATLPPKPIVLTFDDGYIDFYVNAYPILKKYGFHATLFIPTGLMDQGYYLTWNQIQEMNASGLISFEAHSVNHPNMAALTPEEAKYQVLESKRVLEAKTGRRVNFFAYPYGASNQYTWQAVQETGFIGAVGTWYGSVESEGNIFDMPRIKIPGGLSIRDFAAKISIN